VKTEYSVKHIGKTDYAPWLLKRHYAKRIPHVMYALGLFNQNELLEGVCTYGMPASPNLCKSVCGEDYCHYVLELNRLIVRDGHEPNLTSHFVSKTLKLIETPKILISYADSFHNHYGKIYQALSWYYTGLSHAEPILYVDGEEMHRKNVNNRFGTSSVGVLRELGHIVKSINTTPKFRYVKFIGSGGFKRRMLQELRWDILEYPRGESGRYDVSDVILQQARLF